CFLPRPARSRPTPFSSSSAGRPPPLHSAPTRRSSDLDDFLEFRCAGRNRGQQGHRGGNQGFVQGWAVALSAIRHLSLLDRSCYRSEEHTSELQSRENLVCRLLIQKKNRGEDPGWREPP